MEKKSIPDRIEGFKRFYNMENPEGPILGFYLESYYPLKRFRAASKLPHGVFSPNDLFVDDYMRDEERLYNLYEDFGGDLIYTGSAFWGVPWLEAIIGCEAFADKETGSSRSVHTTKINKALKLSDFDKGNPWVKKAVEFLEALVKHSNGRYPLGTTLMRGISDLLSALYGSAGFLYKLIDNPEEQKEIVEKLTMIWISFAKAQLDIIPSFYEGVGSYSYNMWMPGCGVWLQEDAAALLSPELYEQFISPCINKIIESFDSAIIHLHPTNFIPIDTLLKTDLSAIEIHIDFGGPSAEELYPYYKKILAEKPLIIWGDISWDDLIFIHKYLDREGLAIQPVVKEKEEAERIWKLFNT